MKGKLALLTFLATAITIGGVYATWTFAENASAPANTTVNIAMTGTESTTEKGTLSVKATGFTLAVDDSNNDHQTDLKKEGNVIVTFTPAANAPAEVKTNGVDVEFVISYAPYTGGPASLEEWKYEDSQIFSLPASTILETSDANCTKDGSSFVWTIDAEDIGISLANVFTIDTLAKYNAMNTVLSKGHFVLTVSEYTA